MKFSKSLHHLLVMTTTVALSTAAVSVYADTVNVAVAANFTEPAKVLAEILQKNTGHEAQLSFGPTGGFYTQIKQGAPFDVFLAADAARPERLEKEGDIAPGSRFTYAIGQVVLWSARDDFIDGQGDVLKSDDFNKLAIANPKLAPYGAAAMQTMDKLGITAKLESKLVTGESIGQTYGFVGTGNAELGFVAMSQVMKDGKLKSGSVWVVPSDYYEPIVQDAVILKRATDNPAAKAWVELLQSPEAKELIRSYGYAVK